LDSLSLGPKCGLLKAGVDVDSCRAGQRRPLSRRSDHSFVSASRLVISKRGRTQSASFSRATRPETPAVALGKVDREGRHRRPLLNAGLPPSASRRPRLRWSSASPRPIALMTTTLDLMQDDLRLLRAAIRNVDGGAEEVVSVASARETSSSRFDACPSSGDVAVGVWLGTRGFS